MKTIVTSLGMIVFVAAIVAGGTGAFFSDTETSSANVFTAGAIDLTVDSQQHYNNAVCVPNTETTDPTDYWWQLNGDISPNNPQYPVIGSVCDGTWEATNLGVQKFWNFADVKPGDNGENTVSIHIDSNPAWLRLVVKDVVDLDNSCTEPEQGTNAEACTTLVPEGTTPGAGELRENLLFSVFTDANCNNIQDQDDVTIITAGPIDLAGETWTMPQPLPGDTTTCFGVVWSLPSSVGNDVQTDSTGATMEFQVEQSRNNPVPFGGV